MSRKCIALLAGIALLTTAVPALTAADPAVEPGHESENIPCEDDPFCRRVAWQDEFGRICAQTDVATALDREQLQQLILDSDDLLPRLEALPSDQARLYSFRLKSCRAFFVYALQLLDRDAAG